MKKKILRSIKELHSPFPRNYGKMICMECAKQYPCKTSMLLREKKKNK